MVLTIKENDYPITDNELTKHIHPTTKVFRIKDPKSNQRLSDWSTQVDRKIANIFSKIPIIWKLNNKLSKITRTICRPIIRLLSIPDSSVGCLPKFLCEGYKIIRNEKPDIIFSTSPPATTHLAGWILSKIFKITWAADLRDEWTLNPTVSYPGKFYQNLDQFLEKSTLNQADIIISTTLAIAKDTASQIGRDISHFVTITNGHILSPDVTHNNNLTRHNLLTFIFSGLGSWR